MLKFRGFRASLNLPSGKKQDAYEYCAGDVAAVGGAYRANREEFFGNGSLTADRKTITPSMVKLPPSLEPSPIRQAQSTGSLVQNLPTNLTKSVPDVSLNPNGPSELDHPKKPSRSKEKQKVDKQKLEKQKQLEKQRAAEQKKREKEAALEMKRIEKENKKKKSKAPKTPAAPQGNIPPPPPMPLANPLSQSKRQVLSNQEKVSRTSGPPPYEEVPDKLKVMPNARDNGNTSFSRPVEEASSWELVSAHRQQLPSQPAPQPRHKATHMDLHYSGARAGNSDA